MKAAAILAATVFAGLSAAQAGEIPKCAQTCASEQFSSGSYAGCGTNAKCICENKDFLSTVACCLVGVCSEEDQAKAVEYAQQICSAQGVQVPTAVSCTTGASATGTAASAASTASGSGSAAASGSGSAATTAASASGSAATAAVSTSSSSAFAPQQTGMRGAEILGGLVAAVAML